MEAAVQDNPPAAPAALAPPGHPPDAAAPAKRRKPTRKERKQAARLPFGTFWIGAFGRAALAIPASAVAVTLARRASVWPPRATWWLALELAAPAAFGLGGTVARMQAYLTWGRRRLAAAAVAGALGAPLGAFEALLTLVGAGGNPTALLFRRVLWIGGVAGLLAGIGAGLLVDLRIRRRFS